MFSNYMLKGYIAAQNLKQDAVDLLKGVQKDESGATMIEYAIMIGIITVGSVVLIGTVGTWVSTKWQALVTALPA